MSDRYIAVYGPNSRQWWAYDDVEDEYCDPPLFVLDEIKMESDDINKQEDYFNKILETEPKWLDDLAYRYRDVDI